MKSIAILYCISLFAGTFMTILRYISAVPKAPRNTILQHPVAVLVPVKVSLSQAENLGLTLCGLED